ncbi:iron-containing alcohol dehydrogenase [Lentzea aerocolonigenes]|uniref:iron-containing alcohol dehydrogenase n=1 Tax=Lentzea aerocolonigenes TaxID=68170 RepID=UPI0006967010|nr:iron-containing alcohol dehydrogenase [Lentzea aerocolonigenes]
MAESIAAAEFVAALRRFGVQRVTGVPCGHLSGPWSLFDDAGDLVPAASEGAALAIAAGWELGGRQAAVLCQNSGFGNLINPLTSLVLPYGIPALVVMTLRGWPDGADDEPHHAIMGASTIDLLRTLDVPHQVLEPGNLDEALARAAEARARKLPFFLLIPRGSIGKAAAPAVARPGDGQLTRAQLVSTLMAELTDELLVSTTGYLSRQAHHELDRAGNFYMQGSMGHASAIGVGLATANPQRRVVVLDGDGAFLMHLGTGSTIGASGARNLVHVVVDNGCYESTGCQATTSARMDWPALGQGLGYQRVLSCDSNADFPAVLREALAADGPVLLALTVRPTPDEVHPRASSGIGLPENAERFRAAAQDARGAAPVLLSGRGSAAEIARLCAGRRVFVVASRGTLRRTSALDWLPASAEVFSDFHENPTVEQAVEAARRCRPYGADLVVGLGGGSALDVAKAARVLPTELAAAQVVIAGWSAPRATRAQLLLVPTTAGTGSEVTQFATLYRGTRKVSLDDPAVRADFAVVDPELTDTCPPGLTWACAFDTFAHAVESLWSMRSTGQSRELAAEALRLVAPVIAEAGPEPLPAERDVLSHAATLGGRAIDITRTTAAHALAYPLTAHLGVPHGIACAMNLIWLAQLVAGADVDRIVDERGPAVVRAAVTTVCEVLDTPPADLGAAMRSLLRRRFSEPLLSSAPSAATIDLMVAEGLSSGRMIGTPIRLEHEDVRAELAWLLPEVAGWEHAHA